MYMLGKADTVAGWLKALDLDQYESCLVANGFDNIMFLVRSTFAVVPVVHVSAPLSWSKHLDLMITTCVTIDRSDECSPEEDCCR